MNPEPTPKCVYLIDGTAQLFRAYFAIPGLTDAQGLPTNAVYGFATMLRKLLKDERPPYVAAAFDRGGPVFRHEIYAEYKANRPAAPEDLRVQLPLAREVCGLLGVGVLESQGFEADDLIATYASAFREAGFEVVVVASDKDLLQLVGRGVSVLNPVNGDRLDAAGVAERFGVAPEQVRDVLGMMGDSVDNIPGVPGVGEKTALQAVVTYGDLESVLTRAARFVRLFEARDALLAAIDLVDAGAGVGSEARSRCTSLRHELADALDELVGNEPEGGWDARVAGLREALDAVECGSAPRQPLADETAARKSLRALKRELKGLERGSHRRTWFAIHEHADQARLSRELATLRTDAPRPVGLETLAYRPQPTARLRSFYDRLGFRSLSAELDREAAQGAEAASAAAAEPVEACRIVTTVESLGSLVPSVRASARIGLSPWVEGADRFQAVLRGLAIAWGPGRSVFVELGDGREDLREALEPLLLDPKVGKVGWNQVSQIHALRGAGLEVRGWELDVMVAAFLLNSERSSFALERLAEEYLGLRIEAPKTATPVPDSLLESATPTQAAARGAQADAVLRLGGRLSELLEEHGVRELYDTIDGPLLPVLARMETLGIRVDTELLKTISDRMEQELNELRGQIHGLAGATFNIDSPKQLREILFERLGLRPRRKTAKSKVASTDAQTLDELAAEHAIARKLLDYRELSKLKGTYVDALPRMVDPRTGRVHTTFHPTGAATGRLSSSDPNLQNIPARTATGREIRAAFVAEPGHLFLASDYSQVELRILAHLTEDPELVAAFRAGEDIHRYTASRVFGVAVDLVSDEMRRRAKAVNFGILYGMSESRLAREQGMKRAEARAFIEAYFERFSGIRRYIDDVRERARRDGAVRTMLGRVRYFPQLHQRVHRGIQEQALRAAVNTTIQGTAADLMKLAMLRVDEQLQRHGRGGRLLLQVHDELLLEVPEAEIDEAAALVREAMEQVYRLSVPLDVDQKVGRSWRDVT